MLLNRWGIYTQLNGLAMIKHVRDRFHPMSGMFAAIDGRSGIEMGIKDN